MCADRVAGPYDAVIVGSGISGVLIAKQLGLANKKVLILEAGEKLPPNINDYMNRFLNATAKVPESPYPPDLFAKNPATGKDEFVDPAKVKAGRPTVLSLGATSWKDPKQSYLIQNGPLPFASTYERINGGTVRHWLGTSLRNVPADFEMKSRYQVFVDWPIKYADLESWYGKAEREIGVSADVADQRYLGLTFSSDYPMPKIPLSRVDMAVSDVMDNLKIPGIGLDTLKWKVSSTPAGRNSQPYQDRRVCAGNTNCIPICPIQAKYDPSVTLADALRTGNVDVSYQSVATNVVVDGNGRVSEIQFRKYDGDKTETLSVSGSIYILAGNAIETPRLLLMSKNERTPNGVANRRDDKGVVGRFLMDHPLYLAWALAPKPVWGYRGPLSTGGIEVCRDGDFRKTRGAFRVEIGNEGWNFSDLDPDRTTVDLVNGWNFSQLNPGNTKPMFGEQLVKQINNLLPRQFRLGFLVEQSPEFTNRVSLAETATDGLGLPRPKIDYNLSDYTKKGFAAAKTAASTIFKAMGAQEFTKTDPDDPSTFPWPGANDPKLQFYGAGHLVGTYRMGASANDSVVDKNMKSWDHDNLYLAGSGTFPTVATANPTLTIAALCLRLADHLITTRRI